MNAEEKWKQLLNENPEMAAIDAEVNHLSEIMTISELTKEALKYVTAMIKRSNHELDIGNDDVSKENAVPTLLYLEPLTKLHKATKLIADAGFKIEFLTTMYKEGVFGEEKK